MTCAKPKYTLETLPQDMPVFPLGGVLLLPRGQLPLNIFEPRYLSMVGDAIASNRLIGMVQPKADGSIYSVGCAGRITSFHETDDGRNEIVLTGVCRFTIEGDLPPKSGYRRVKAGWAGFRQDLEPVDCLDMDRARLKKLLKGYFERQGLTCSWDAVDNAADERLITSLAMICPFDSSDKQALLEAPCCKERAKLFITLLEMEMNGGCGHRH